MTGEIIKAALLGTDKYMPKPAPELKGTGDKIAGLATDKEDKFLKLAIATLLYEEAGRKPLVLEGALPECPAEIQPVVSIALNNRIRAALTAKDDVLFHYFVYLLHTRKQVLSSDLVPLVLNKALENKKEAFSWVKICGETGKWLCGLNTAWQKLLDDSVEENVWETGSFDNRKIYLAELRATNPAKALGLLQEVIDKENAANRAAFVELLEINLSLADEPFLQSLLTDKSQKVKDAVVGLLRQLQGSVINNRYLDHLLSVIKVKEERYMLISKKKVLTIREDLLPGEDIFNTGIGKVSSDKGVADHIYIIGQLLGFTDPAILAGRLLVTEDELLTLLLQHTMGNYLAPFLSAAAARYKNKAWALLLLKENKAHNIILLDALQETERVNYYGRFIAVNLPSVLAYLFNDQYKPMPLILAKQLLEQLSKEPYTIQQPAYQRLALHMPAEAMESLINYREAPGQDYQQKYFKAQVAEMVRIMDIRNNTI
jgi:hypothetical protein